jgi:hypothetical protein
MVMSTIDTTLTGDKCVVQVESILRLRPLQKKEKDEQVCIEPRERAGRNSPPTVVLLPINNALTSPQFGSNNRFRADSDAENGNLPHDYHFNHVLSDGTSQDKVYYTIGLPMATQAMESLKTAASYDIKTPQHSHLLICMGVVNSGKTYTCFGGTTVPKRRAPQDGLVPRITDSLFSQSAHHANSTKGFSVQISIVQVAQSKGGDSHACQVQDLLAKAQPKTTTGGTSSAATPQRASSVLSMAARFDPKRSPLKMPGSSSLGVVELDVEDLQPAVRNCRDSTQAREVLQAGLLASRRAAKGHHNYHLLITLQPVLGGSLMGDKIAILDMAGLEKGAKPSNNRGKDSAVNNNEAANAAVLHCLRLLTHNTNVRSGKTGALDVVCTDDMASEISCVSQEKDPYHRQIRPVPFRQHKLTMLLNPLFATSSSAKVTLLLAAYPGHVDYYEKKSLLQDMELLCGTALLNADAAAATGLDNDQEDASHSALSSVLSSMSDESSVDQGPAVRSSHNKTADSLLIARSSSFESTEDDSLSFSLNKDSLHFSGKHNSAQVLHPGSKFVREGGDSLSLALSESTEEDEVIPLPPAYAPTFRSPPSTRKKADRLSAPFEFSPASMTAPPSMTANVFLQPPQNPNFVSDFPGVAMPPTSSSRRSLLGESRESSSRRSLLGESDRRKSIPKLPSTMVGGFGAKVPPLSPEEKTEYVPKTVMNSPETRPRVVHHEIRSMATPNIKAPKQSQLFPDVKSPERLSNIKAPKQSHLSPDVKSPLQPSSIANVDADNKSSSLWKSPMKTFNQIKKSGKKLLSAASERASPSRDPVFVVKSSTSSSEWKEAKTSSSSVRITRDEKRSLLTLTHKQVERLEAQMKAITDQKRTLEKKCTDLENENKNLKNSIREGGRKNLKTQWTDKEQDEEWQQSRKQRLQGQQLVQGPLWDHINDVNRVYDIKNQCFRTNKTHFTLGFPGYFQRAPALDLRDKANAEKEASLAAAQDGVDSQRRTPPKATHYGKTPPSDAKGRKFRSWATKKNKKRASLRAY